MSFDQASILLLVGSNLDRLGGLGNRQAKEGELDSTFPLFVGLWGKGSGGGLATADAPWTNHSEGCAMVGSSS